MTFRWPDPGGHPIAVCARVRVAWTQAATAARGRADGPRRACPRAGTGGFTLIEMLVALTIIAILSTLAAPSFTQMMAGAAIRSLSTDLGSDLNFARAEAVRTGSRVSLCPRATATSCGTDWNNGWLVFRDTNGASAGTIEAGDQILRARDAVDASLALTKAPAPSTVTYMPAGAALNGVIVSFAIRHASIKGRDLSISAIGRLTTTVQP
ncbi:MAG: GspH/FimT family pseudopilin [Lautropia sp.]